MSILGVVLRHDGHEIVPVEAGGEVVAALCVPCDTQLPPEWYRP